MDYVCPRCGNKDSRYIGIKNNLPYCRRCISLQGKEVNEYEISDFETNAFTAFTLTEEQQSISNHLKDNFINKKNTLINAVCGAGKTELVFQVISYALTNGLKIGFAIPRRDVVIELFPRLKSAFSNRKIISVYGGHNSSLEGDIIILTTHQLFRYENFFDLLIMDEIDAFPFEGNQVLINIFKRSVKGNYILMSATPSKEILNEFSKQGNEIIYLHTRFHKEAIPVPKIIKKLSFFKYFYICKKLKEYLSDGKPVLVFEPTIEYAVQTFSVVSKIFKNGRCVHSKCRDRLSDVSNFKLGKLDYLVTTSILERGITVKNLQVIVNHADHEIYNSGQLIQISGRVGRKKGAEKGDVIFICSKETEDIKKCVENINYSNSFLNKYHEGK